MKNWIITSALLFAIIVCPFEAKPQEKPPIASLLWGCFVLALGAVAVIGVVKLCKKLDQLQYGTNAPPFFPPPITDPPPWITHGNLQGGLSLDCAPIPSHPLATPIPDTYSGGSFTNTWAMTIQASTDLQSWHDALAITVWESDSGGAFYATYRGGTNSGNYYFTQQTGTNSLPVDFTDGRAEKEFFRVTSP
jgi:hypothetical protein